MKECERIFNNWKKILLKEMHEVQEIDDEIKVGYPIGLSLQLVKALDEGEDFEKLLEQYEKALAQWKNRVEEETKKIEMMRKQMKFSKAFSETFEKLKLST